MLQALLRGKLDRWLSKDAYSIEDLLTSVVLGSAGYAPPEVALLPFLRQAIDLNDHTLAESLRDVVDAELSFWPRWGAFKESGGFDSTEESDDDAADDSYGADEDADERVDLAVEPRGAISVSASEPEVVVKFTHAEGPPSIALIEAKLHAGKSSHERDRASVNDQLAKYWLQLKQRADAEGATALGVIYLTTASRRPDNELQASQRDLESSRLSSAPIFWLSWRTFYDVVGVDSASPLLRDCARLLKDRWNLVFARVESWGTPPELPLPYEFRTRFQWPDSTQVQHGWRFEETEDDPS